MGLVLEFEARVSRKPNRTRDGKLYYEEYIVIPRKVRGERALYGKRVHVKIEVLDP